MSNKKKTILLTGALGLAGRSIAIDLIKNKHKVILTDLSKQLDPNLQREIDKCKGDYEYFELDINTESFKEVLQKLKKKSIYVDVLLNNAYPRNKNYGNSLKNVKVKDFNENINLHLGGYFNMMQQFINFYQDSHCLKIINMSSIYGVITPRFNIYEGTDMTVPVEYSVIKSSLIMLTKYFARYYKEKKLIANCISMGGIYDNQDPSFVLAYNKFCLNKGMLDMEDIFGTINFLISDSSNYINGQNIIVDDGFTL